MTVDRILLFTLPLVTGLAIPAILAMRADSAASLRHRAIRLLLALSVGLIPLLLLRAAVSSDGFSTVIPCWVYLTVFHAMIAALVLAIRSIGAGPAGGQAIASLVVILMMGSIFAANPLLEYAQSQGTDSFRGTATFVLSVNPWIVLSGSILRDDPLHEPFLYRHSIIGDQMIRYPSWWAAAVWYAVVSAILTIVVLFRFKRTG